MTGAVRWGRARCLRPVMLAVLTAAGVGVAAPDPSHEGFTRMDTLFLTAATGEPRFAADRARAESALVALDTVALRWLVRTAGRERTPRQRHYADRLFRLVADSGRNDGARRVLGEAIASAPDDTLRATWLHAVSRLEDPAARVLALPWLDSGASAVRRMAARTLGEYPHLDHVEPLRAGLAAAADGARHMRLWALTRQPPARDPGRIPFYAALLGDSVAVIRGLARDRMLRDADSTWARLRKHMPRDPAPALRREWWLLASATKDKAGSAWLHREAARMSEEDRRFFGLR